MSEMILDPEAYFRRLIPSRDKLLVELEEEARQEEIPIIGPVVGELLFIWVRATQAAKILELGTATGYSAIYLARACEAFQGTVLTLEKDSGMAGRALANFKKAGLDHRIEIRVADAMEAMAAMEGPFDFIFMDIDKADYTHALTACQRLLKYGGLLVADNVGFKDAENFNKVIRNHSQWRSVHLLSFLPFHSPEKDGLCIALRI